MFARVQIDFKGVREGSWRVRVMAVRERHISTVRLRELTGLAIIEDKDEAQHIKECRYCRILLRWYAVDHSRRFDQEEQAQKSA